MGDELEGAEDFHARLTSLIRETIHAHKRIIFNGNGYDEAWIQEAAEKLSQLTRQFDTMEDITRKANFIRDVILPAMERLRRSCHQAEACTDASLWPFPTYGELLFAVTFRDNQKILSVADDLLFVPSVNPLFSAAVEIIPLQLLAYYVALENGCDIDKPKNLSKSVTVE